jgi:hypothetical protein
MDEKLESLHRVFLDDRLKSYAHKRLRRLPG